jgi:hypothetical protein
MFKIVLQDTIIRFVKKLRWNGDGRWQERGKLGQPLVLGGEWLAGYYGFEWEKRWHHEIDDPEAAFPHFAKVIRYYLAEAGFNA